MSDTNVSKDLTYYKNLPYNIILGKNKDVYTLYIKELALFVKDKDLEGALQKLESRKSEYFKEMLDAGMQDEIKEPENVGAGRKFSEEIKLFVVKLLIVLITGVVITAFAANEVKSIIRQAKQRIELQLKERSEGK